MRCSLGSIIVYCVQVVHFINSFFLPMTIISMFFRLFLQLENFNTTIYQYG